MSRIQARAVELEWRAYRDADTYHPLRDGPRQYAAVWVVERMRRFLPPDQVQLAHMLHANARALESTAVVSLERVDGSPKSAHDAMLKTVARYQELQGYEAAALARVGSDGRLCFLGIIGGDGQAELARRVKYPADSHRSLRKLVQITLDALAAYRDENDAQASANLRPGEVRSIAC